VEPRPLPIISRGVAPRHLDFDPPPPRPRRREVVILPAAVIEHLAYALNATTAYYDGRRADDA
jgi:hypothetical protein